MQIVETLFEDYKQSKQKEEFKVTDLETPEEIKKELNSLYKVENCLDRYGLLKLSNSHYICNKELNYLFDSTIPGKHLLISSSKKQSELIEHLRNEQLIGDVSFQVKDIWELVPTFEEKQYGQKFEYDLGNLPEFSKFFDVECPDDNLWITIEHSEDKSSLTFETTKSDLWCDDIHVVTNLVHLEVTKFNGIEVISHIDHEYIVYNFEEYDNRLKNKEVKGYNKIKTFKIDNSIIPFNYTYKNAPVLYSFIMDSLEHKQLIKEYFEKVIKIY